MKRVKQQYVDQFPIGNLVEFPNNPNEGDDDSVNESVTENGFYGSIQVNATPNKEGKHEILAGNTRFRVALAQGAETVPVLLMDVSAYRATKILLADNATAERGKRDPEKLIGFLDEVGLKGTGYRQEDYDHIKQLLDEAARALDSFDYTTAEDPSSSSAQDRKEKQALKAEKAKLKKEARAELAVKWGTELGQLWKLGEHLVACADCTHLDTLRRMWLGQPKAAYTFTSPPYGIGLEYEKHEDKDAGFKALVSLIQGVIKSIRFVSRTDKNAYATLNYADIVIEAKRGFTRVSRFYDDAFAKEGDGGSWVLSGNRIWQKPYGRIMIPPFAMRTLMNLREYEYLTTYVHKVEEEDRRYQGITLKAIWPTFGEGGGIWGKILEKGIDVENEIIGSVQEIDEESDAKAPPRDFSDWTNLDDTTDKATHPAAFPLILPMCHIPIFSKPDDVVFEPFMGSGTTLIACEILKRRCFGTEIDPVYMALVLERFQDLTGIAPEQIGW